MPITFIDLFAGIGGFRLGLERANLKPEATGQRQETRNPQGYSANTGGEYVETAPFSCVWSCEIDRWCERVYRRNFGQGFDARDIRAVDASSIPDHDLLTSGFPCQSFSIAGKRRGFADTRGTLFFDICRILRAKRPRLLLLENVKGLLSDGEGRTFHTILESLDELGYDLQWEVLNSKNFGVPQNRERVFIVGHLGGTPRPQVFPLGEDGEATLREVTELTQEADQASRIYDIEGLSPTLPTPSGGRHIPKIANALDVDGYLRFGARPRDKDGKPQLLPIGYRRLRRLTPLECERLQGFPDGWTEGISDTQRYRALGNAVTVNVVEAIGERLIEVIF